MMDKVLLKCLNHVLYLGNKIKYTVIRLVSDLTALHTS